MRYYIHIGDETKKEKLSDIDDIMEHLFNMAMYFKYHNKNLTKNQYYFVADLIRIFEAADNFGTIK